MGRSKFPGKPTKHVNRTRINVLSTVVNTTVVCDSNPTVVTVEEGDNSKKVKLKTSKRKESIEQTSSSQRVRLCKRKSQTGITNKRSSLRRSLLLNSSTTKLTRSKVARRSVRGYGNLRKLSKNKLSTSPKKESSNLVGKFVLPSRSVHSSRVIKPNKRFINIEQNETRLVKKRVVAKRQCTAVVNDEESTKTDDAPSTSTGKVVLRQARLQIGTSISAGADGPFSSNHNKASIVGPAGTVTCGVCGAVRFCRFVKQARKFNIYSCESCRRFISKLIQRVSCNKASTITLNCHKGQGTCHVPPTVHNQQWKFNRITYNSRCPACWLKQCLRSFHIPMTLKTGLTQFLPKHMQTNDTLFASSLPLLSWPSSSENQSPKTSPETNDINLRQRPVRLKLVKKDEKTNPPPVVNDIKRQKIDLKGPRVKHVCRSASIVLGQPIAVFPRAIDPQEKKPIENTNSAVLKPKNIDAAPSDKNDKTAEKEEIAATMKITRDSVQPAAPTRREKAKTTSVSSMHPIEITKPSITKKSKKISPQIENTNVISIDYWENYDPDEIIRNGFSIIASESFPMQAICYLCGSAGKESLLYCCICCEPYHPFCLEQGPPNIVGPEQKYTWICPKCTTCSACGEADRQKINCQKCHKAYHPQCFNTKWRTDDRPTVCSNCLRCKSCGTDNITKFVGNVALCLLCFKLRNKGNFCPICQCCYDDNDFDTKMMECGKCNKWVHAKCESLSDEQYQILSILPESVEFLCCLCSNQPTPYWKKAVQLELRSCFNNILRLLSKNRVARDMLKLSPFKPSGQTVKQLGSARRLQFVDNESNLNADIENSIDSDLEQVNAIFKNKINFGDSYNSSTSGESKTPISPSMVEIKNKLNCNEYFSLSDFNEGMEHALKSTSSNELLNIYHNILKKVFPWFDPNVKKTLNKYICDTFRAERNEETEKKFSFEIFDVHAPDKIDHRVCNFCKGIGDGLPDKEARLLYCGQNDWVHANCALWSSEVYEEIDGSLQNVQSAVTRGRSIRCALCKQKGATVGCCRKGCYETYHFPCAQKAKCHFIVDKTMYCSSHEIGDKLIVLSTPREFEIRRPVYIEVDTRKKKLCEPEKINFMIGSLTVINLGKVIPSISDHVDALIPVGFVCSRLFWSTTEPWKLIPYKITLSVLNSNSSVYVDKNFTVDHTLPKQAVEKKLREICSWRDDKEKCDAGEYEDCEEPQNTGDILSPELTDAILEELPHDLLDGISVQDVLMGYEELMNIDFKNTEINCTDLNTEGDSADDKKRSKSDVYQRIEDKIKPRQKSCSLTWLQLDNTLSPAMKKRKIAPTRDNMFMQLLQVDGACDSSGSECGSPTRESEIVWSNDVTEEPVTCEKCQCTYRTDASYKRHLESCEAMFTSESETENETLVINVNETPESQLVTSYESFNSFQAGPSQVQSTVMNSQTVLSETNKFQESSVIYNYQPIKPVVPVHSNVININQTVAENQFCVSQQNVCVNQNVALNQPNLISLEKNSIALNSPIISVDNAHVNNQINPINGVIDIQQQPVTLQSVPYTQEMQPIINIAPQNQAITIDAKMLAPMVNLPQNQWVRPILNKPKPRPRIVAKRPRLSGNTIVLPQNSASVILQHIPSTNILPFVDTFQPVGQNMHYLATIAPQLNSAITPQPQLVQLQDNFINIVPNVQPTMIIQQPRVDTGQLIVDGNGSMMWAPQPIQQIQPVYYGFETIVQNTVMQSQQFLPTTVPGVLTTNSSYSATTQVFQTSKLEPVMDGSFVLVNSNPHVQMPQVQTNIAPQPQPIAANVQIQAKPTTWSNIAVQPTPPQPPQPVPAPQVSQPALQHVQSMPVHSLPPQPIPPQPPKTIPPPTVHAIQPKPIQPLQTQSIQPLQTQSIQPLQTQSIQPLQPQSIQPLQQPQPIQSLQIVEVPQPKQLIKPVESSQPVQSSQPVKPSQPIQTLQPVQSPTSPPHEPLPPLPVPETPPKIEERKSPPPVSPVTIEIQTSHIQIKPLPSTTASTAPTTNSITLPVAPFVPEQGIPTNIVTPTVKPPATQFRPMNRVLPMQTTQTQLKKPDKLVINKETANNNEIAKNSSPDKKPKIKILGDIVVKQSTPLIDASNIKSEPIKDPEVVREETKEVKPEILSPIKESKVERDCPELIPKIHIAPLKPIKTKLSPSQIADKENNIDKLRQPEVDDTSKLLKYNKRTSHSTSIFYKIESPDGIDYTATSLPQIWRKVFTEVQAARLAHNLPPLPEIALRTINDLDVLGLRAKGMRYLLEQLPEVAKCKAYKSVFHKHKSIEKVDDDDDEESSRRCLPFERRHEKYDMFGWLSSKHRTLEMYDLDAVLKKNASSSLPMAMRFRALRVISKYSVGVYRSDIHGRGLFSLRDIESGEMVIEYAGEVIRSLLTDKREKYYNSKGIGCYMFRIDDNLVVDATMKGNAARFINHSCDPNCYSKVVEILGCKHIIIFALRKIICGEELTYDYKFPFEEDKIPCTCGTKRCRKFLN